MRIRMVCCISTRSSPACAGPDAVVTGSLPSDNFSPSAILPECLSFTFISVLATVSSLSLGVSPRSKTKLSTATHLIGPSPSLSLLNACFVFGTEICLGLLLLCLLIVFDDERERAQIDLINRLQRAFREVDRHQLRCKARRYHFFESNTTVIMECDAFFPSLSCAKLTNARTEGLAL